MKVNFKDQQINQLDSRQAMGLPEHYQEGQFENIEECFLQLKNKSPGELVHIIEYVKSDLKMRYVAGTILSLIGDPRIKTWSPNMILIQGTKTFTVGISVERAKMIARDLDYLGVLEEWVLKETPEFQTEIKDFYLSKYLVTNKEYRDFLIETKFSEFPTSWSFGQYPHHLSNHPVFTISIEAVNSYIEWISKKTGKKFRLATENEWEYAACSEQQYIYPWGDKFLSSHLNTAESKIYHSTPVGIFPEGANGHGVLDLAGNIEEYVSTKYYPYPGSEFINDDLQEENGDYNIARGGSFTRFRDLARNKRRHGKYPSDIYVMGLRLCLDA